MGNPGYTVEFVNEERLLVPDSISWSGKLCCISFQYYTVIHVPISSHMCSIIFLCFTFDTCHEFFLFPMVQKPFFQRQGGAGQSGHTAGCRYPTRGAVGNVDVMGCSTAFRPMVLFCSALFVQMFNLSFTRYLHQPNLKVFKLNNQGSRKQPHLEWKSRLL